MTYEEFLPISDMRKHCGITGSSRDALLMVYREAAAEKIEAITRRNIISRTITVQSPDDYDMNTIRFDASDAQIPDLGLALKYRAVSRGQGFDLPDTYPSAESTIASQYFRVTQYTVEVLPGPDDSNFPEKYENTQYQMNIPVGMIASDCPPVFRVAGLFIVREMNDGSALDALPDGVVDNLLRDHVGPPLTLTQMDEISRGDY